MRKIFNVHLKSILDMLCGDFQPFQPLPASYYQQTDWSIETRALQMPAAWRRQPRVG